MISQSSYNCIVNHITSTAARTHIHTHTVVEDNGFAMRLYRIHSMASSSLPSTSTSLCAKWFIAIYNFRHFWTIASNSSNVAICCVLVCVRVDAKTNYVTDVFFGIDWTIFHQQLLSVYLSTKIFFFLHFSRTIDAMRVFICVRAKTIGIARPIEEKNEKIFSITTTTMAVKKNYCIVWWRWWEVMLHCACRK